MDNLKVKYQVMVANFIAPGPLKSPPSRMAALDEENFGP